jgi:hypothetical protein
MYSVFPSVFLWELTLSGNLKFLTALVYITTLNTMRLSYTHNMEITLMEITLCSELDHNA